MARRGDTGPVACCTGSRSAACTNCRREPLTGPHENKEPAMAQKSRTIHPADAQATDAMISDIGALVDAALLCRYTAGGHDYLHHPDWQARHNIARPIP